MKASFKYNFGKLLSILNGVNIQLKNRPAEFLVIINRFVADNPLEKYYSLLHEKLMEDDFIKIVNLVNEYDEIDNCMEKVSNIEEVKENILIKTEFVSIFDKIGIPQPDNKKIKIGVKEEKFKEIEEAQKIIDKIN